MCSIEFHIMWRSQHSVPPEHEIKNKVGQRTQKQDGTQHDFLENLVVCALHEIDVRSLLKHRAR